MAQLPVTGNSAWVGRGWRWEAGLREPYPGQEKLPGGGPLPGPPPAGLPMLLLPKALLGVVLALWGLTFR